MSEPQIDIRPDHWAIVRDILQRHVPQYAVWAFGSRAKWTAKEYSDLDLAIITDSPLPLATSAALAEDFSESDLPWKVDIVDWAETSETFRKIIERDRVVVQEAKENMVAEKEWREVSLGEIYEFSSGLSKPRSEFGSGYPFLSFKDVFYNSAVPSDLTELVNSTEQERSRGSIKRGDVFLTRTSETLDELGMSSVALADIPNATFNGFSKRLRPKQADVISPEYARYFFRSDRFRTAINSMSSMSTRASLNNEMLERLTIFFPSLKEQESIGKILCTLDNKIELNRRMKETLEAMARSLFKSWFVDFEPVRAKQEGRWQKGYSLPGLPTHLYDFFPDRLGNSDLGEIPDGWKIAKVESVLQRLPAKIRYTKDQVSTHGKTPVFEQGASIVLGFHDGDAFYKASVSDPAFIFGDHTCITRLSCQPFDISQNVIPLRGRERPTIWVYYAISEKQNFEEYRRHWMELISKDLIIPPENICSEFSKIVSGFYIQIESSERESQQLAQLRDTLLPKLISGEVRIKDAERLAETA